LGTLQPVGGHERNGILVATIGVTLRHGGDAGKPLLLALFLTLFGLLPCLL